MLFILFITGCAPERKNFVSNTFHNTTAHYNAYFYAHERIKEIKQAVADGYQWNYNKILPIFPEFDSTLATSMASQIDDCIKKASIAIQRHPESNWEDDSYVLVGLARYYSLDFPNAVETFKYVNTHSENDNTRHEALIALINTYIKNREYKNAEAVSDYLKKEKLNKKNLKNLYLSRAYLHQQRDDLNFMVQNLTQAEPLITNQRERARVSFIIGQVYQHLGFDGEAYSYYKECLSNNPGYELSFYTKLNMAQVTQLAKSNDLKKIRKYFKKLLIDAKNVDFKDKIYYEMANFEVKHGNLDQGIEYYNASVRSSTKNKRQKAYSYLSLGKIYYDSLANYKLAKLYYDSTIAVMPQDEAEFAAISERQQILADFVKQLNIIQTNDSLIALSRLSADSLDRFLDDYIAQKTAEEKERKEKAEAKKKRRTELRSNDPFNDEFVPIGSNNFDESVWYFYNQSAVDKGRFEFEQVWGNRPLEDNWRRTNKSLQGNVATQNTPQNLQAGDAENKTNDSDNQEPEISKEELIATIPYDEKQQATLLSEVEHAHYNLGNIYNFNLDEKSNAASTFEKLLARFSESEYKLEVMYLLYLIYKDLGNDSRSNYFKNTLINDHPNSIYAKVILNPNYREESQAASEQLKKIYRQAYQLFKTGDYTASLNMVNDGLEKYPDNDFVDNMELLKILLIGRMENIYQYQYELNNFIRKYTESELVPYADSLVKASENFQINIINSSRARYRSNINKPHYFVFVFPSNSKTNEILWEAFNQLKEQHNPALSIQSLILDAEHSMLLVDQFDTKESALDFLSLVTQSKPEAKMETPGKVYPLIITKENFEILYNTKELDTYLTFYRKNY